MSKRLRGVLIVVGVLGASALALSRMPSLGGSVTGERRARAERSGHFRDGHFQNLELTHKLTPGTFWPMIQHQLFGTEQRVPERAVPIVQRHRSDYASAPASGLRATWIGHASVLLELDGARLLLDPVFSARCSPVAFIGPMRFFAPPIALGELPKIDAVIISHDHYDHLDMASVQALAARGAQFVVPLGIGAHLERWGVPAKQIDDLDWYEHKTLGRLQLTATPARHYSGRRVLDSDATLWASWVIAGDAHRVFFSGDTGYTAEFRRIGQRFGPFDLTLIKAGASDPTWEQIHMSPEDAVRAHQDLRGRLLLPVHWGTFNLANHAWNEPAERIASAARAAGVSYAIPRPGEWVEPGVSQPSAAWWR